MKKVIFLLLLLMISCNDQSDTNNEIYSKIQGDWLYHNSTNYWENFSFLSVMDSLIFYGEHIDSFETFRIENDTIKFNYKFYFSRITPKYLRVYDKTIGKEIPRYISTNVYYDDIIKLRGFEARFMKDYRGLLDWGIILDEENNCFVKIESTKASRYIKNPFNLPAGTYKCDFDKNDFEFFQNKLRNVPFDSLKNSYSSKHFGYPLGGFCSHGNYDIAVIFLDIHYSYFNNSEIKTKRIISYGFEGIPSYLGVFINYINKINNFVEFKVDTTSFPNFNFYSEDFINANRDIFYPFENFKPYK